MTALYRLVGDVSVIGECITVWPPVVWAGILAPRIAWLWLRGARREAALAAACVAAFVLGTTELPSGFRVRRAAADAPGVALRVVTWNVAGRAPYEELEGVRPDIVFVQEGGRPPATEGAWRGFHWHETLDPAVLSRFPVRALPAARVGPWMEPQVLVAELGSDRRVVLVNVRLMLPAIVVAAASGDWNELAPAHRQRVEQFTRLAALVERLINEERTPSLILAGDFNSPGGTRALEPLRRHLRDAWEVGGRGWGGTMTAELPLSRIDQLWITPDFEVIDARVQPRGASDHRAVSFDLRLR